MVKVSRILKDYRETGSLNSLIAVWGFVDEHAFLTKSGALGVVLRVHGVDAECLDHVQRRDVVHRFEQALRLLDERFRLYQYMVKRQADPVTTATHEHPLVDEALRRRAEYLNARAEDLFTTELYVVLLFEGWSYRPTTAARWARFVSAPGQALSELLSTARVMRVMDEELTRGLAELHHRADAVCAQLSDTVRPELLGKAHAFAALRQLLDYTPGRVEQPPLKHDTHLDFYLSDATVECHRDHLLVGDARVKVLTMKEPPARTFADILAELNQVPAPFIACLEWQRIPDGRMRRTLHARRRHFFNRRISLVNYISPDTKPDEMLVDDSASATVGELGQCLTNLEVHGQFFGACSLTVVIADRDTSRLDHVAADVAKVFARHDGTLFDERYNLLNAWLAVMPGNSAHNLRRLALLNTNVADLSFLFAPEGGERTSAHLGGREHLAAFETQAGSPYFWNLHVGDVGHALILGATGSGKSFLLNFILTHAQKYDPTTVIFDLGSGYDRITERLGGKVWKLGIGHADAIINPFCLDPTPENLHFLSSLVGVLLRGGAAPELTAAEQREIDEGVQNLYTLDGPLRRLGTLRGLLSRELAGRLHRWVEGGAYASIFDHSTDTLTFERMQCFDFQALEQYPLVLEPLLFYVLHRASATINHVGAPGHLKLFALDEAWRFARDATVRAYMTEALKTWRKKNAAMLLATQSAEDFGDAQLLRTVVESCPTKLFLANPAMDRDAARHLFHLNETEAGLIAGLRPRQQLLLKRPDVAKVLNLHVDPQSYWLYTNTPSDNERLHAAAAQHGVAAAVDILAAR